MNKGPYNPNIYKTSSTDAKPAFQNYNQKLRTGSVANKSTFASQGNNIIKCDSKTKNEFYREDISNKMFTYNEPKKDTFSYIEPKKDYSYSELKKEVRVSESRGSKGIVGFRNLGNTCFMNSILQCLVRLPPFRDALSLISRSDICSSSKLRGNFAMAFKSLILEVMNSNNFTVISPSEVKTQIGFHSRQFQGYDQQDSAELFRCILEGLNIELNSVTTKPPYREMTGNITENLRDIADRWWNYSLSRDNSLVTDFFQGQFSSIITCKSCSYGSISCDSFLCMNLPSPDSYMRSTSIDECLSMYFKESHLQSYRCEKCKQKGNCSQKISLYRFPKILVLQLKRFHVDGFRKERLNTDISYPDELNLENYKHKISTANNTMYKLYGISHHIGSLYSGHYIAECRENNRWYSFDDTRTSSIETPTRSTSAYLLFYTAYS